MVDGRLVLVDEKFHDAHVSQLRGDVQRGAVLEVDEVWVGVGVVEELHGMLVPFPGRHVEGTLALFLRTKREPGFASTKARTSH